LRDGKSRVEAGDSRYHAIFGAGPARFVHPSTLAPALIALGARLVVAGRNGEREIAIEDLYRSPRTSRESELTLGPQELIRKILVPIATPEARSATYEVRSQQALDWPLVACSVSFRVESGVVRDPRVVLGHVAPTPWRCLQAEQVLAGQSLENQSLHRRLAEKAGAAAIEGARPLRDNAYKIQLARVATQRALLAAMGV
jgi:xanthine dehydrogenase YagS FAD-binding subunit